MDSSKRKHIIETAMKLFNEHGFHATPTSKIAKESQVSVGTLFNYFEHKEDLIQAIYIDIKLHSKKEFFRTLTNDLSDHDLFQSMWRSVVKWGIKYPEEFKYMNLYTHSIFKKQHNEKDLTESYQKLTDAIVKVMPNSLICCKYPQFSLLYLNNAFQATTEFILNNNVEDCDDFIDTSFDLFWKGFSQK